MTELTLKLTDMAHGGSAIGRDENGRLHFVPFAIPGETVRVRVTADKNKFNRAELLQIITPSPDRLQAPCPHFGPCGGCHFQHMRYERQLQIKQEVVRDQLERLGGFKNIRVPPVVPHPSLWQYLDAIEFSPAGNGRLGFWSPSQQQVIPIHTCHIIHPQLEALMHDIDLDLPGLRKMTLRRGSNDALLAALEVDDVEAPELETDFPVSVAIVLPDNTAASLVGDIYLLKSVKGREFRVSPGCFFQPSAADALVDTLVDYAQLSGKETVIDAYSGVGMLTAFLAEGAAEVVGIEVNGDAVADTAVNLHHTDNVSLYEGWVEDILPALDMQPDLIVLNPPSQGLSRDASRAVLAKTADRLIYVSSDIATLARDGKQFAKAGYKLAAIQPIDLHPQTFHIDTVSLWKR
jgi:23S rRNA (uracil1939-C5)-methyltransferase